MSAEAYADQKAVARANREFYRAFEALDSARMQAVWSRRPDVQCIHPGGEALIGPELVHASWAAIFAHTPVIRFEVVDLSVRIVGSWAWVSNVERIRSAAPESGSEAGPEKGGELRELVSEACATNLFEREPAGWRMLLHHASPIARRFTRP